MMILEALSALKRKGPSAYQTITGWFSPYEAEALYLLTATSLSPRILEVGHFLGRSTSAMCEAIRDAGSRVEFNSYDLGFTTNDEFLEYYNNVHQRTVKVPAEFARVFSMKMTTTEVARKNLEDAGLAEYVNLVSGDFSALDPSRYGFIFCDALHDRPEIQAILPSVMKSSEADCVWAFHDMTADNVDEVVRVSGAQCVQVIDHLGVFRYRGD